MWKIQKGYSTVTRTFRLPEDLTEKLEAIAAKNDISLNKLVTQCLAYAIKYLDEEETQG